MVSALNLETSDGFRIFVENGLRLISPYVYLEQETWFEFDAEFVRKLLKPGMRIIDIGANVGYYTLLSASIAGSSGHVWAFEPGRNPARLMRESVKVNGFDNVTVLEKAVGASRGTIHFSDHHSSELSKVATDTDEKTREVALESIDALYSEGGMTGIDFIKIDAEGFEADVITGAQQFFRAENPVVMIEVSMEPEGPPAMLQQMGYAPYRYCTGTGTLVPFTPGKVGDNVLNLFMCKPERAARLSQAGLLVLPEQMLSDYPAANPGLFLDKFLSLAIVRDCPRLAKYADTGRVDVEHNTAMAEFVMSEDPALPAAERAVRLDRAVAYIERTYSESVIYAHLLTYCRIWEAAGRTHLTGGSLRAVIDHPEHSGFKYVEAPFLPVAPEWDERGTAEDDLAQWLKTMVLTTYERVHSFSSYYGGDKTLSVYRYLRQTGQATEWFERRAVLKGFIDGITDYPMPIFIGAGSKRNREIWQEIRERMKSEAHIPNLRHCVELADDS